MSLCTRWRMVPAPPWAVRAPRRRVEKEKVGVAKTGPGQLMDIESRLARPVLGYWR